MDTSRFKADSFFLVEFKNELQEKTNVKVIALNDVKVSKCDKNPDLICVNRDSFVLY